MGHPAIFAMGGNWRRGFGSRDDEFSWRRDISAQRCAARLAQRLQVARVEDAGGRTGIDGPKDHDGEFQTEMSERYQRSEKARVLAMLQMYVESVSTRKVSAITEAYPYLVIDARYEKVRRDGEPGRVGGVGISAAGGIVALQQ